MGDLETPKVKRSELPLTERVRGARDEDGMVFLEMLRSEMEMGRVGMECS